MVYGDYFDNILSWWPHRNDENVLMLKYEDMTTGHHPNSIIHGTRFTRGCRNQNSWASRR